MHDPWIEVKQKKCKRCVAHVTAKPNQAKPPPAAAVAAARLKLVLYFFSHRFDFAARLLSVQRSMLPASSSFVLLHPVVGRVPQSRFLLCFLDARARSFAYLFVHLVLGCRIKVNFAHPSRRFVLSFSLFLPFSPYYYCFYFLFLLCAPPAKWDLLLFLYFKYCFNKGRQFHFLSARRVLASLGVSWRILCNWLCSSFSPFYLAQPFSG